jgi:hypothetical protein
MQESPSIFVSGIDISPAIDQHHHHGPMTRSTCPMQRSVSIFVIGIKISPAID